jgi:hypothetical protein
MNGNDAMTFNQTGLAVRFIVGAAAAALCSVGGISAANAETPDSNDAAFKSFVADMKVDASTQAALTEKFDELSEDTQEQFLDAVAADPVSVLEFEEVSEPTLVAAPTLGRASASRYTATYPVNATLLGIATGTFNLRYVFEATPSAVTRNLECTCWFTGSAGVWSINSTSSQYVSGGTGNCTIVHRMSFLSKGSGLSANKQYQLSYRGTSLVSGWLKNV